MVLADSKYIEADLICVLDLFDKVPQPFRSAYCLACFVVRRRETVNANFHVAFLFSGEERDDFTGAMAHTATIDTRRVPDSHES
jgi:hypothetical protein